MASKNPRRFGVSPGGVKQNTDSRYAGSMCVSTSASKLAVSE